MFEFSLKTKWKENLKDKMITFIDLYRKEYKEPIKDVKYKRGFHDDYRMIITYKFENVDIQFESVETDNTKWIALHVDIDSEDKKIFDEKYNFISNILTQLTKK